MASGERSLSAVILAAGKGQRMGSSLAKVLHRVGGNPLVRHVVEVARTVRAEPLVLVVGHQADAVREVFGPEEEDLRFAFQANQLGTGHAAAVGISLLEKKEGDVLILCGDVPLLRAETLGDLVEQHRAEGATATLLSAVLEDPGEYGRVLRSGGADGSLAGVVEEKDATPEQRAIREINSGTYVFDLEFLGFALPRLEAENAQKEFYLPDVIGLAVAEGRRALAVPAREPEEALGVNTRTELEGAERIWAARRGSRSVSPQKGPNLL